MVVVPEPVEVGTHGGALILAGVEVVEVVRRHVLRPHVARPVVPRAGCARGVEESPAPPVVHAHGGAGSVPEPGRSHVVVRSAARGDDHGEHDHAEGVEPRPLLRHARPVFGVYVDAVEPVSGEDAHSPPGAPCVERGGVGFRVLPAGRE